MDNISVSTKNLKQMKEELRLFSTLPTAKIYKIMSTIYKAQISNQQLIDSEITKSFARIALKNLSLYEDDEKKQKSIKIARKLLKKWKEMLSFEDQPMEQKVHKKIKPNHTNSHEKKKPEVVQPQLTPVNPKIPNHTSNVTLNGPSQEHRDKAIQGIQRYITKFSSDASQDIAKNLEIQIFQIHQHNQDNYKNCIKSLVKKIDQFQDFRNQVYATNPNYDKLIEQL